MYHKVPIILGQPFLATRRALLDVDYGKIIFQVNNEDISFNVCMSMKQPKDLQIFLVIDIVDDEINNTIKVNFMDDLLVGALWNLGSEVIEEKDKVVNLTMCLGIINLGYFNRNPCENNTLSTVVVDNLSPRQWNPQSLL